MFETSPLASGVTTNKPHLDGLGAAQVQAEAGPANDQSVTIDLQSDPQSSTTIVRKKLTNDVQRPETPSRSDSHIAKAKCSDGESATRDKEKEKGSRLPACESCKSRKIKCDALLPACTPCRKGGRECIGRDKAPNVSRGMIWELQQKVKDLEGKLAAASSPTSRRSRDQSFESIEDSGSESSRGRRPRVKRRRYESQNKASSVQSDGAYPDDSSSPLSSPMLNPIEPSPNDLVQQTSTIFETLSSDLPASARQYRQSSTTSRFPQTQDDDEASTLAALTKHRRDRTLSPKRLKRRSSSNTSKHRMESGNDRAQGSGPGNDVSGQTFIQSRPRSHRFTSISIYDKSFFDRLISRYLSYMNRALPVVNEVRMREMAARIYDEDRRARLLSASNSGASMLPPPLPSSSSSMDRTTLSKHRCIVLMALSIALASLGRSHHLSSELRRLGHQYWSEAQSLFLTSFRYPDLDKLRAVLLQVQYAFLVPTAGSVWELSGAAIRLVTELNLHFDRDHDSITQAKFGAESIDIRRRLFWTSYCLDRSLAVALARPPGLSDAWIHVQLPSLLSDADLVRLETDASSLAEKDARPDPSKQSFRSHINLRRIQSEILCRLHSVNPRDYSLDNDGFSLSQPAPSRQSLALVMEVGPPTPNVEWQARMMEKLGEWKAEFDRSRQSSFVETTDQSVHGESVPSTPTPFVTQDWIDLNYNLSASLLFRPSPNNPRPDQNGLKQAFTASGHAMKTYKSMHRNGTINFPWLATHHLFISGLTHLNSLEKLTRLGAQCPSPIVDVIFNVQSCASTLEALTSREDGYGARIRDTFDAAASAVLRTVLEPNRRQPAPVGHSSYSAPTEMAGSQESSAFDAIIKGTASSSPVGSTHQVPSPGTDRGDTKDRRASHHEALLLATQHPTWLSDSTWNSINSKGTAPPPGSTILVAAPPRQGRSSHSNVPTLSERTTQNIPSRNGTWTAQPSHLGGVSSSISSFQATPRGLNEGSSLSPFSLNGLTGASFQSGQTSNGNTGYSSANITPNADLDRTLTMPSSTFGFHNWLLQPYEGGADGISFSPDGGINNFMGNMSGSSSTAAAAMSNAFFPISASSSNDPLAIPSVARSQSGQETTGGINSYFDRNNNDFLTSASSEDAGTLLDFLSMIPSDHTSPQGRGRSATSTPRDPHRSSAVPS